MRLSRRRLHQLRGVRQIEVDELSAIVADRVIVPFSFTIVPAGTVSKIDFENESRFFQVAQRVIDGGVADTGQTQACRLKNITGRRVVVPLLNDLKNCLSLGSQLRFFRGYLQSRLRIILNLEFVKQGLRRDVAGSKSTEFEGGFGRSRRSGRRNFQTAGSEFHVARVTAVRRLYRRVVSRRSRERRDEAGQ